MLLANNSGPLSLLPLQNGKAIG